MSLWLYNHINLSDLRNSKDLKELLKVIKKEEELEGGPVEGKPLFYH